MGEQRGVAQGHGFYVVVARTRWKTLSPTGRLKAASDLNASSTRVKSSVPWFFFHVRRLGLQQPVVLEGFLPPHRLYGEFEGLV